MEKLIVYGIAVANALFDALLILPNAYMWREHHQWVSIAAMVFIGALGVSGLIAAPFVIRRLEHG